MELTFVRTRHVYDSYTDYWHLVDLCGFPTCYIDEVDVSQRKVYIVSPMNGEWRPHIDNQRDREKNALLVLWHLERPQNDFQTYQASCKELIARGYINTIIVSDRELGRRSGNHYVPIGGHKDFGKILLPKERDWDIIHSSCYSNRRGFMFKEPGVQLDQLGIASVAPCGIWGDERDEVHAKSRFTLAVHQDDDLFIEPLRWITAAMYAMPVIAESVYDAYPYIDGRDFMQTDISKIIGLIDGMVRADPEVWFHAGLEMRERMITEFSFKNCLEKFL